MEQDQLSVKEEAHAYSVPWKPLDNWVGVLLLVAVNAGLLVVSLQGTFKEYFQSAGLVVIQLAYLIPLVVIFAYRRVGPAVLGFGRFAWNELALGCGLVIAGYMVIFVHNIALMLLGVDTQGEMIFEIFSQLESPVWLVLVGVVFAPLVEEIFFRGFLFQGFRARYGWVRGALLSSVVFGAAHLDPVAFIPTAVLGFVLSYVYHRTQTVWPGVLLHGVINAFGFCSIYVVSQFPGLIPS
jgi:membrane protease YdiL (CAAX protease family)